MMNDDDFNQLLSETSPNDPQRMECIRRASALQAAIGFVLGSETITDAFTKAYKAIEFGAALSDLADDLYNYVYVDRTDQ